MTRASFDFNKYAGKEINVLEKKESYTSRRTGETTAYTSYALDREDSVTAAMIADIKASGARVRIWLPDTMGTMDHQPGRMNIRIDKNDSGKWRINPQFRMG